MFGLTYQAPTGLVRSHGALDFRGSVSQRGEGCCRIIIRRDKNIREVTKKAIAEIEIKME